MAVILHGFSLADELLLKLLFPFAELFFLVWIVFRKESFDVTLHLFLKTVPLLPESVKGREACGLEFILFNGFGMADEFGLFRIKSGQTAPYHGFLAAVVPLGSVEVFSAFTAEDNLGKDMATAESAFSAVCGDTGDPAHQFILHLEKDLFWNNGLVVTLHVILRHYAVVLYTSLVEKVGGVGLLEQGVFDVLFIRRILLMVEVCHVVLPAPVEMPSRSSPALILSML